MNLNSKIFDRIRIKSRRHEHVRHDIPGCEWDGCMRPGPYRAPKGHRSNGEHHNFCLEHVRHYNQAFNFFADAEESDLEEAVARAAANGERATWRAGSNAWGRGTAKPKSRKQPNFDTKRFADPLNLFARLARNRGPSRAAAPERRLLEPDRRAFEMLGLVGHHASPDIKRAYKTLVKKHHPDANGGDRGSEDRLRAIIAAYTHLKSKGFV